MDNVVHNILKKPPSDIWNRQDLKDSLFLLVRSTVHHVYFVRIGVARWMVMPFLIHMRSAMYSNIARTFRLSTRLSEIISNSLRQSEYLWPVAYCRLQALYRHYRLWNFWHLWTNRGALKLCSLGLNHKSQSILICVWITIKAACPQSRMGQYLIAELPTLLSKYCKYCLDWRGYQELIDRTRLRSVRP